MLTIVAFIVIFLLIVLVHEWGHFFAARKSGMRVEEFGFGLPPKLFSIKGKKTEYSFNLLPIGGFVRIAGENGYESDVPKEEQFESKPWYAQSLVLIAGVLCNLILGFVLFFSAYISGVPVITDSGVPTIVSINSGSAAEAAHLEVGDIILNITDGGKRPDALTTDKLHTFLLETKGPITLVYQRVKTVHTVQITPQLISGQRMLGVAVEPLSVSHTSLTEGIAYAWQETWSTAGLIFTTVGHLIAGLFTHNGSAQGVLGPVGLYKAVGSAAAIGFAYLLAFAAALSINLAVINILPFPALDGGRLVVVLLEKITGRTFSKNVVAIIHAVGFVILIGLMIVLTFHDLKS